MTNCFIAFPGDLSPWSYHRSQAEAEQRLQQLQISDSAKFGRAVIFDADQWIADTERRMLDASPAVEVTADEYREALEVLPPIAWTHADGVERFCMSEFTSGRVTKQYAQLAGRYLCKSVIYGDKSTYLTARDFAALNPLAHTQEA